MVTHCPGVATALPDRNAEGGPKHVPRGDGGQLVAGDEGIGRRGHGLEADEWLVGRRVHLRHGVALAEFDRHLATGATQGEAGHRGQAVEQGIE